MENSIPVLKIRSSLFLAAVFALALPDFAQAEVLVQKAWVRSTPGAARGSAAYAVIVNTGTKADRLMEVSSPDAAKVEIHSSQQQSGIITMTPIEMLAIPARATVDLKPGANHVMITGLTRPLRGGETLPLTFSFEFYGDVDVEAMVSPLSAMTYPGPAQAKP
jgi:copper(I)-binding protein